MTIHPRRLRPAVAALLSATTVAALVTTAPTVSAAPGYDLSTVDPTITQPATDSFYTPPADLPSTPGTVIRSQFAPQPLDAIDTGDTPGRADKILYTSTTQDGDPVAVSGLVIEPTTKWAGEGPTPTIVFAPGTRGSGDDCAPSRTVFQTLSVNPETAAVNSNYEYTFNAMASALGYRVIVTDYIGLGTPGQHTYVNHTEEGHAVLDAARAGLAFSGAPADSPVAFYGYSQGGGGAAGAAEHAASYAPELNVKGTFAGAPPASLDAVTDQLDQHLITGVLGYALNGAIARTPGLREHVDELLNDEGKRYLTSTADECDINSGLYWMFRDTSEMTKDGRSFGDLVRDDEQLRSVLLGDNYRLGTRKLNAPMLMANGRNDDTIPWSQARDAAADYCSLGSTVEFSTAEIPPIAPKFLISHVLPMATELAPAFQYMNDRFNDVPAPNNCGQF